MVRTGALRDAVLTGQPVKANDREAFFGMPKGHVRRPVANRHKGRFPVVPILSGAERRQVKDKLRDYIMREVD